MARFSFGVLLLCAFPCVAQTVRLTAAREAPRPERMAAEVVVCGDASRLETMDIARIDGPNAPPTFSGDFLGPYDGFHWYASRHYALATDMDDDAAREALVLLELAWPQYGRIFGWRPPGGRRMAVILASNRETLGKCLVRDSIHTPLLGGLTQEGFACSYLYAGTPYQTRYILLHEATHLYQYCLSGDTRGVFGFLREGIADYFSSHIYDPESRTLRVNVLDRAPIHNHLADGLAEWKRLGRPTFDELLTLPSPSRGISVLLTAFLQHTDALAGKWRLLCERIVRDAPSDPEGDSTLETIAALYRPGKRLDEEFKSWAESLAPTFELVERDFDQSAPDTFRAIPVSPSSTPRLRITDSTPLAETLSSTSAPPFRVLVSRPPGKHASAGFSGCGIEFSASNTWSGACIFRASCGDRHVTREVPSAYMRAASGPLGISVSRDGECASLEVTDTHGEEVARPLRLDAAAAPPSPLELFASGGEATFMVPHLGQNGGTSWEAPRFLQEIVVTRAFGGKSPEPITSWRIAGPFSEGTIPAEGLDFRTVEAHPATPLSPPMVNLCEVFGDAAEGCSAVAEATIVLEDDSMAALVAGIADGIVEIRVNGDKVFPSFAGKREWRANSVQIWDIPLKKGPNTISLHLSHKGSAWLISAGLVFTM